MFTVYSILYTVDQTVLHKVRKGDMRYVWTGLLVLWTVQCTVYSVQCKVCSVQCKVQCKVGSVEC